MDSRPRGHAVESSSDGEAETDSTLAKALVTQRGPCRRFELHDVLRRAGIRLNPERLHSRDEVVLGEDQFGGENLGANFDLLARRGGCDGDQV